MAWLVTGAGLLVLAFSGSVFLFSIFATGGDSPDAAGMLGGIALIAFLLLALPLLFLGSWVSGERPGVTHIQLTRGLIAVTSASVELIPDA